MDFLDHKRKRAQTQRLFIGYGLMAIIVAIGTIITLNLAYGYDIDRGDGTVIQNGIVFVDSKPDGATIYVNDKPEQSRTASRMVLPAGTYTLRLEAEGYRTWQRTFNLEGGQIQRLVYPLLLPNNLAITDIAQYDTTPQMVTQSPDRRWVLVQRPGQTYQFDVYDLADPEKAPELIAVPVGIVTNPAAAASLKLVEWSNTNRHLVLERAYDDKREFLLFDREVPEESANINSSLGIVPESMSLRNKRPDQFYYLDAVPGVLRSADLKARTISGPLLSEVTAYKTYGDNVVLYVTLRGAEPDKVDFRILDGDNDYLLKTASQAAVYMLDVAKYDNEWFYVAGSAADNTVLIYKDPVPNLRQTIRQPANVYAILRLDNPQFVSFSANTQFIAVQSENKFITIDLEDNRQYRFSLAQTVPIDQTIKWMDGHRLLYVVDQQSYIIDFDGSNPQTLVTSRLSNGLFFDRDYDNVFTVEGSKTDNTKAALTRTVIDQR
jgi:hypothetical protein